MNPTLVSERSPAQALAEVNAWLEWFAITKQIACRAYLCTRYHLNLLDAEALINTACLQLFLHWATVEHPLTYFWHTLKHAVGRQKQRGAREQQGLAAYAQQHCTPGLLSEHTTQYVADLLEHVPPRQRQLLTWYAQDVDDVQVAAWLQTTLQAVRVARHSAYRTLRAQDHQPRDDGRVPQSAGGETCVGRP